MRMDSNNRNMKYYVEGSTARKLQVVPDYEYPRRREQVEEPKRQSAPRRQERSAPKQSLGLQYTVELAAFVICTLFACVYMLQLQAKVTSQTRNIAALESSLAMMTNDNDAKASRLEGAVDLKAIEEVAVNELGMVYPGEHQIVTYQSTNPDYVVQYCDIPEAN